MIGVTADLEEAAFEFGASGGILGTEVHDGAAPRGLDGVHRGVEGVAGGAGGGGVEVAEDVAQEVAAVHAHEGGFVLFTGVPGGVEFADAADGESDVRLGVDDALVGDEVERAAAGADGSPGSGGDSADEGFTGEAVLDDLGDGAELEVVLACDVEEVGEAGHFAVVAHDLDDGGGGVQAGEAAEVDGAFGLSGANEDAAVARAEGVDVAGADEVVGAGGGVDGHLDAPGALAGGDAGGEAVARVAVDGDGEGGAADGGVDSGLGVEVEAFAVGAGEGEAEVAPGDGEHEGDGFGGDVLGGEDEVALVLAILIVGENDHAAGAEVVEDFGEGGEHGWWRGLLKGWR